MPKDEATGDDAGEAKEARSWDRATFKARVRLHDVSILELFQIAEGKIGWWEKQDWSGRIGDRPLVLN